MTVTIENTSVDTALNIAELTQGSLTGNGVFDVLLQTLRLHLDREFTSGRITGTAYATVYSQAITSFLQQAVQFCLSKSKLALELERMREEVTLVKLQQDKLLAETVQVKYNTDEIMPLQKDKVNADIAQTYKQTNLISQQLENLISEQLGIQANTNQTLQQTENLKVQEAQLKVEVEKSSYELETTLPEQVELIRRNQRQVAIQTQIADYELTYVKPIEVANLTKTGLGIDAQTAEVIYRTDVVLPSQVAQTNAQKALLDYDLTSIKPVELLNLIAQKDLTNKQVQVQDEERLNIAAKTSQLNYDLANIKPVELSNLELVGLDTAAKTALVVQQKVNLEDELLTSEKQRLKLDAETSVTTEAITTEINKGLQIAQQTTNLVTENNNLVKQGNLLDSQKVVQDKQALSIEAGTNEVIYRTTYVLPSQVAQNDAQTASVVYTTANLLPKQVAQITAQTSLLAYDLTDIKPKEAANLAKTGLNIEAQTGQINAVVATKLPKEVLQIEAQTAQSTAQTSQITYTTSYVLPSQVALTTAQKDSADAQTALYAQKVVTEQAQATNAPAATSVMGVQNALMEQQKNQIIRDAEQKTAKIMLDSWQTIFTTDQTLPIAGDIALLLTHTNAAKLKMLQGVGAV